jgi:hypothetical protein
VPTTTVSHIVYTDSTVSFRVGRLGVPVLVKVPYFPNWTAVGAAGPYEATPNLMVVVPHSHHVVLHYGTTLVDWLGGIASGLGILGLAAVARFGTGARPAAPESGSPPAGPPDSADPASGEPAFDTANADGASLGSWYDGEDHRERGSGRHA